MTKIIAENREAYSNLDSDTRELLEVVAKVKIPKEYEIMKEGVKNMTKEDQKFDYCKAWVDQRLFGVEEGKREHLVQLVCKKLQKAKPVEMIADELEEEIAVIEKIIAAQQRVGSYDTEQICNAMTE